MKLQVNNNQSAKTNSNENSQDDIILRGSGQSSNIQQTSNSNLTSASSTQQNFQDVTNILQFKNSMTSSTDNCSPIQLYSQLVDTYIEIRKRLDEDDRESIAQIQPIHLLSIIKQIALFAIKGQIELEQTLEKKTQNECNDYESSLQQLQAEIRQHIRIEQQLQLYAESTQSKYEDCQKGKDQVDKSYDELKKKYEELKFKNSSADVVTQREQKKDLEIESLQKDLKQQVNLLAWYEEQMKSGQLTNQPIQQSVQPGNTNESLFNPSASISNQSDNDQRSKRSVSTFNNTGATSAIVNSTTDETQNLFEKSVNLDKSRSNLVQSSLQQSISSATSSNNQQSKTEVETNGRWSLDKSKLTSEPVNNNLKQSQNSLIQPQANLSQVQAAQYQKMSSEERYSLDNNNNKSEIRDSKNQLKNSSQDERNFDEKSALNKLSTIQSLLSGQIPTNSLNSNIIQNTSSEFNNQSRNLSTHISGPVNNTSASYLQHSSGVNQSGSSNLQNGQIHSVNQNVNGSYNGSSSLNGNQSLLNKSANQIQQQSQNQQKSQQQYQTIQSQRGGSLSQQLSDIQSCLTSRQQTTSMHVGSSGGLAPTTNIGHQQIIHENVVPVSGNTQNSSVSYLNNGNNVNSAIQNNVKLRSSQSFSRETNHQQGFSVGNPNIAVVHGLTGYTAPGGYSQTQQSQQQQQQQSQLGNGGNSSNTYVSNFNNYLVHQQQQQPQLGSSNYSKGNNIPRPSSCLEKQHPTNNNYVNLQSQQQPQQQQINQQKTRSSISPGQQKHQGFRSQSMDGNNQVLIGPGMGSVVQNNNNFINNYPSHQAVNQIPVGNSSYTNNYQQLNNAEISKFSVNNINLKQQASNNNQSSFNNKSNVIPRYTKDAIFHHN